MWKRLSDPDLVDAYRREVPNEPLLAALLAGLRHEPWARQVSAVVSLGSLRLTTAPSWEEGDRHGCVVLSTRDGKVAAGLIPAGVNRATEQDWCSLEGSKVVLSVWLQQLLGGYSLHPLDAGSTEDPASPVFVLHQRVRVCSCGGRSGERRGMVRSVAWHHKHARWNYYLQVGGKALSKRYYSVDLLPDDD